MNWPIFVDQVLAIKMIIMPLTLWSRIRLVPSVAPSVSLVVEASGSIGDVVVLELWSKKLHDKRVGGKVGSHKPKNRGDMFVIEVR